MGEVEHITNPRSAIETILAELDWAYRAQMLLVEVIGDIQADPNHRLRHDRLKQAAAARLRKSVARRDAAVAVLDEAVAS